ncbi:hypothetical protein MBLNU230_g5803t1 [Neophaeotheca triangularis]
MLSRSAIGRQAQRSLRHVSQQPANRRGMAAPASGSYMYQTGESNGIKIASRDIPGPVGTLAIVSKAGTRYEPMPGLTEGLEKYAFKGTQRRSALRIQRESELLGSDITSHHTRENLVIGAKFLRDDLPYFVELLAEVAQMTKYQPHVFHEEIVPQLQIAQKEMLKHTDQMAINNAHGLAFHRGLGAPLHMFSSSPYTKYLDADSIAEYAASAYSKPMFSVVANGAEQSELSKWVGEFFTETPSAPAQTLSAEQSKYFGGEERIAHGGGNTMVIGFPGSSTVTGKFYKPEVSVLAALLGGQSSIKWSRGFSLLSNAAKDYPNLHVETKSNIYSDAGLLTVMLHGSASDVSAAAKPIVDTIRSVADGISDELFQKAKAFAKFRELEFGQNTRAGMELTGLGLVQGGNAYQIDEVAKSVDGVTAEKVQQAAKEMLEGKASVSTVGDLYMLPYAEEVGLKV